MGNPPPSSVSAVTSPLGLRERLRSPGFGIYSKGFAVTDILVITIFCTLLGSRFVLAPGLPVDLPRIPVADLPGLPSDATMTLVPRDAASTTASDVFSEVSVLSLRSQKMILFNGEIRQLDTLAGAMEAFIAERKERGAGPQVLLLKASGEVPLKAFMEVCALARAAGFARVQVAAKPDDGLLTP